MEDVTIKGKIISNQQKIVSVIRDNNGISRTEIAKELLLSVPSVSKHIDYLIEHGLVYEDGLDNSSGGRRPIVLKYNYKRSIVLLISTSSNSIDYKVSYLDGDILFSKTEEVNLHNVSFDSFVNLIHEIISTAYSLFQQLDLVVLSTQGLILDDAIIKSHLSEELNGSKLKAAILARHNIKLIVKSDTDYKVLGKASTLSPEYNNISYLFFDFKSIKLATMINQNIVSTKNGTSGEVGNIRSSNGQTISERLFEKKMSYVGEDDNKKTNEIMTPDDWADLLIRVSKDSSIKKDVYNHISNQLSLIVNNIIYMLDIDKIYIGGDNLILNEELVQIINDKTYLETGVIEAVEYCSNTNKMELLGMLDDSIKFLENQIL